MKASFGGMKFWIFNIQCFVSKALPQSPEISLCSASLFIHGDAVLIRKPH